MTCLATRHWSLAVNELSANLAAALDLATVTPSGNLPRARLVIAGKILPLSYWPWRPTHDHRHRHSRIRPYLAQATVAISPMRYGVGIQNKVLEAMARSTPVVSTPQAVSALQMQVGEDVLVADTPTKMAQVVELTNR
jgi:hypothetical protein